MAEETKPAQPASFLTRSKAFKKLVKWAFDVCDSDKSGSIQKDELYTGVLLVHLNIASEFYVEESIPNMDTMEYAGAAACFPATKETVDKLFDASDVDDSGTIDEDEFMQIMIVCCGQILSRVVLYLAMLLVIVPMLAKGMVMSLASVLATKAWFITVSHLVQDPISKIEWLDSMFDWDTLFEDVFGIGIFFGLFPIVFGAIDHFYQAAAESRMLESIEASQKREEMEAKKAE